jgi:hypothetical protein
VLCCVAWPVLRPAMIAAPVHLPQMLAAARAAAPQLRVLEDHRSPDPRLPVRFPAAGQRFRVHPGSLLNPVLTLRSVAATAEAIDDFVVGRHGFRLTDLLEVALRYCGHRMAGAWPNSGLALDRPDPPGEDLRAQVRRIARAPITVTATEVRCGSSGRRVSPAGRGWFPSRPVMTPTRLAGRRVARPARNTPELALQAALATRYALLLYGWLPPT